jgi:hypothetical protein
MEKKEKKRKLTGDRRMHEQQLKIGGLPWKLGKKASPRLKMEESGAERDYFLKLKLKPTRGTLTRLPYFWYYTPPSPVTHCQCPTVHRFRSIIF